MKISFLVTPLACCLFAVAASAADFAPGDRVHIGSVNKDGTVLAVGQALADGGTFMKIHVDGAGYPADVGVSYDSATSQISLIGRGIAPGAAPAAAPPQAGGIVANNRPPGHVPPDPAGCQQAIRANYIATGDDQTINVSFLNYTVSDGGSYTATYAGDLPAPYGRGHTVQALTIHAIYKVLVHYADPYADDELRTYDANFKCYDTATTGELIAEMTDRLDGGEHATYIHKQ